MSSVLVKGEEAFHAKVAARRAADPSWDVREISNAITDHHRTAYCWPARSYLTGVTDAVSVMQQQGHRLLRWRNLWRDPAFAGISSLWLFAELPRTVEVELHTDASWEARTGPGYDLYYGYTDRRAGPDDRDHIEWRLRQLRRLIPVPEHACQLTFAPSHPAHAGPSIMSSDGFCYFAVADGLRYTRSNPLAVIRRRLGHDGGRHDEAYTRGYPWRSEYFLLAAEHGDCQFDFLPVDAKEAGRLTSHLGGGPR